MSKVSRSAAVAAAIAAALFLTFSASVLARALISAASSSASRIIRCIRLDNPVIDTGSLARLSSWVRSSSASAWAACSWFDTSDNR